MAFELIGGRITLHLSDPGVAVAGLSGDPAGSEAVLAFAHHTSRVAVRGAIDHDETRFSIRAVQSHLTHLHPARGSMEAAAIVERELAEDLAHDIRRTGSADARVAVAVVDSLGDAVAIGTFDFRVTSHEEEAADAGPNDAVACPPPFLSSILARNIAN